MAVYDEIDREKARNVADKAGEFSCGQCWYSRADLNPWFCSECLLGGEHGSGDCERYRKGY